MSRQKDEGLLEGLNRVEHGALALADKDPGVFGPMSPEMIQLLRALIAFGNRPEASEGDGEIAEILEAFVPAPGEISAEGLKKLADEDGSGTGAFDPADNGEEVLVPRAETDEADSQAT